MLDLKEIDSNVSYVNEEIYYYGDDENSKNGHEILSKWIENHGHFVTYVSDGERVLVKFLGFVIWDSDEDERKYNEEKDEYEHLGFYLMKKIRETSQIISFIKDVPKNKNE